MGRYPKDFEASRLYESSLGGDGNLMPTTSYTSTLGNKLQPSGIIGSKVVKASKTKLKKNCAFDRPAIGESSKLTKASEALARRKTEAAKVAAGPAAN